MSRALTHRRILAIAVPIVISNATVPLLGLVDTGVVGQLGAAEPIGAVAIGALILSSVYWICGFLRMGTTGMTSQALGAEDMGEVAALLQRGLLVGFGFGLAVIVLQWPLFIGAFALSPATPEVEAMARSYMAIRVWSAPATIALYAVTGWLIAHERSRAVLALQVWMNGLNILLDVVFVLGLGWGVEGVAIATFLAEWTGLALGLWLCRAGLRRLGLPAILDPLRIKRMISVNGDILIRTVALQSVVVTFMFWGAGFGNVELAANQVLMQFVSLVAFALDGFAFSSETLVGQAMGRKDQAGLRRAALMTSGQGAVAAVLMALAFAVFGGPIIDLLTTAPEVRAEARVYLPYMILGTVIALPGWMLDGIFIGATRSRDMRNMMLLSFGLYLLAAFPLMSAFGNHGLWMALIFSWIMRGITLGSRYPALERAAS